MIGVSACLAGICCTYRGDSNENETIKRLYEQKKVITICPEVLGGLSIPRDPSEIVNEKPLKVMSNQGKDVTKEYLLGAQRALAILKKHHVTTVILKSNSPSCGVGHVYDGTFSHRLTDKDGITARILRENGISLLTEKEIEKLISEED